MLLCPNPKCDYIGGKSKNCPKCGCTREPIPNDAEYIAESIRCGGNKGDRSTCNEEIKRTQNFCQTCGTKVDEQRFRLDICYSCQCVLISGSRFCHMCGANIEGLGMESTGKKAQDGIKQLSLVKEKDVQCPTVTGASNAIPELIELPEKHKIDTLSGLGLSADELKRIETAAHGGVSKLHEYIKARNDEWKYIELHIAVTGNSGVGKSSFINALRGVKKGENGYAETGVTEKTTEVKGYPHPQNKSLVFWDMPGVGTPTYLKDDYLTKVQFEKYDFFLIFSNVRFTENDMWLANEIRRQRKTFYFIRTKIGNDVYNARQPDSIQFCENDVIAEIRKDCIGKLKEGKFEDPLVFLIDSYVTDKYDFGTLVDTLLNNLPETKREAMALSLTFMTKKVIMAKRYALRKRIIFISVASAVGGAVPFPGVGAAVDSAIILGEAEEYKRQFGLTEEALLKYSPKHVEVMSKKFVQNLTQVIAAVTVDEAAENALKFGIPLLGSILSGTFSYGVSVTVLWRLLNSMVDDALRLNEDMIKMTSSETDV